MTGTDWLATLREQADIGKQMAHDVPLMLARPDVTLAQVRRVSGRSIIRRISSKSWQTCWKKKDTISPSSMQHVPWRICLPNWRPLPLKRWFRSGDNFPLSSALVHRVHKRVAAKKTAGAGISPSASLSA